MLPFFTLLFSDLFHGINKGMDIRVGVFRVVNRLHIAETAKVFNRQKDDVLPVIGNGGFPHQRYA